MPLMQLPRIKTSLEFVQELQELERAVFRKPDYTQERCSNCLALLKDYEEAGAGKVLLSLRNYLIWKGLPLEQAISITADVSKESKKLG